MKIAIIGTGGVGGYFGGRLAKAGNEVVFVVRGEHYSAIKKNGLTIKSIKGDFLVENPELVNNISDLKDIDLIILGVKAWQVKEIAPEIKAILNINSVILPLQNGIMAVDELKKHIHEKHILGGLCRIISKIESPGIINHFAVEPTIVFGETDKSISERLSKIKEVLDSAGITCKISDDIEAELWKKFIAICISGLLAVTNSTYGQVRELPETRELMTELFQEIYDLSKKIGVNIKHDFVEKTIAFIDSFPYDSTSSLTRDVWEGKPSEIEYQNGAVYKLGQKYDFETPINKFIYFSILPAELRARKKSID